MTARARRIGLLGGECSGKSTLASDLARLLPACIANEQLREFVERTGRNPVCDEQAGLMQAQQAAEDAVAFACEAGLVIGDSAPMMIAIYSIEYFDDWSLIEPAVHLATGYDLMLWCDIDIPWEADGIQRDGPEVRQREHALIERIVDEYLTPADVRVELLSGERGARVEAARRAWQLLAPNAPT